MSSPTPSWASTAATRPAASCAPDRAVKYQLIQHRLLEPAGSDPDFTRGTLEGDIAPSDITFYRLQCDSEGVCAPTSPRARCCRFEPVFSSAASPAQRVAAEKGERTPSCAVCRESGKRSGKGSFRRVVPYIPDRIEEGYGLNSAAIDHLKSRGRHVLSSPWTAALPPWTRRPTPRRMGIDMIITDHHECRNQIAARCRGCRGSQA
jgi:hypothetical protein